MVKLILHHVWIFLVSGIYGTAIKIRTNQKYGVLIDAGSSSSKLKIYQWNESSDSSQSLNLELIRNTKHKPGISSFVTTSEMSGFPAYLAAIVNEAKSVIPSRMINDTALFLMATAGIRILSEVDARSLIETARRFLSNSNNNPFKYYPGSVRILSGEEEAVFSWITTNYLQNFFGSGNLVLLLGDTSTYVDENSGTTVTVLGGGDPDNCLELLQYFLRTANHDMCWPKPCAIGPIYQPSIGTDIFYAISAFVYAPMVHGSLNNNGRLDIEHLNSTAFEYCQKTNDQYKVVRQIQRNDQYKTNDQYKVVRQIQTNDQYKVVRQIQTNDQYNVVRQIQTNDQCNVLVNWSHDIRDRKQ
ncbi:hypothetical protein KUTeg_013035 [Tegillarca granosa]|uniref:Uncharacterized protein n=1 Tax=Tegillarca granosa TaxID=220873 RepID=A0ABQ9EUY6_TEGGR|nr:hypothetical protein KUTeg_013035 [Tegillarca granosa]